MILYTDFHIMQYDFNDVHSILNKDLLLNPNF